VWHFSGYEVDRHAFQAALLLRFAVLLLLIFTLDHALVSAASSRREQGGVSRRATG
jgi:hypothetical protein